MKKIQILTPYSKNGLKVITHEIHGMLKVVCPSLTSQLKRYEETNLFVVPEEINLVNPLTIDEILSLQNLFPINLFDYKLTITT